MVGQFAGMAILVLVSGMGSLVSLFVPVAYLGLIGFAPVVIGLGRLLSRQAPEDAQPSTRNGVLAVLAATLATGGDNIAVYTLLFATQKRARSR